MNKTARVARKYKSRMWTRYRESQTYNDLVEYKRAQNEAVKEYKRAKKQFERKLSKNIRMNPKSFYSYVRSKTKSKDVVGPLKNGDGKLETSNEGMCNVLNEYFSTVFTNEPSDEELPEVKNKFSEESNRMLKDITFTIDQVLYIYISSFI